MSKDMKTDKKQKTKEKITLKKYIKDFIRFIDTKLKKSIVILVIISIIISALLLPTALNSADVTKCVEICEDTTIKSEIVNKLSIIGVTIFAGIVPYIYAPVVGYIGLIMNEVYTFALTLKVHGYIFGTLLAILPLLLNIISVSAITAAGIYLCKTVTFSHRFSNLSNMNFLNFRIKLYELTGNKQKLKELTTKKNKKLEELKAKKEKVNYLQVINITAVVMLLQIILVIIQQILI